MDQKTKKEKYSSYYKSGKLNIINFINELKTGDTNKLKKLYEDICEQEEKYMQEIMIRQRRLESMKKNNKKQEEISDMETYIGLIKNRLEFIRTKKDIVQKELKENSQER